MKLGISWTLGIIYYGETPILHLFLCGIAGVFTARFHLQNWDFLPPSRKCCVKLYFEGDLVRIFVLMLMSLLISRDSVANGITRQPPEEQSTFLHERSLHGKLTWNRHCVSRSPVYSSSHQLRLRQAECQHRAEMLISWYLAAKSATYYKACHQMAQKITNDSLSRGP